jgi:hypothetical protein
MGLTVNGVAVAEERIVREMDRLREDYETYLSRNNGEPRESELREWAEENLIEAELFRQEAVATQPEVSDARAQQNIEACPDFYEAIPAAERLARSKEALCVRSLEKAVRKQVPKVSDDDVRREYDANPEMFVTSETLRLSHICRLIGPQGVPRAEAYLELLRIKTDLESHQLNWHDALSVSDTYSQDFGLFAPVSRGDLPAVVEEQVFALEPGETSDMIELDGRSLHVFRLLVKEPPAKVGFQEIRERLRKILFERAFQESLETTFDTLKDKAVIQREGPPPGRDQAPG